MIAGALERSPGASLDWSMVYTIERWMTLAFFAMLVLIIAGIIIEKVLSAERAQFDEPSDSQTEVIDTPEESK